MAHRWNPGHWALGPSAVYLFFVLSGFLIFGILRRERARILEGTCSRSHAWLRFLLSRSLRIFPVYYAATLGVWLLDRSISPGMLVPGELPWHLTFTSNLWVGFIGLRWTPALSHFWSLAIEEQFYFLAAPLVLLCTVDTKRVCACFALVNVASFLLLYQGGVAPITILMNPLVNFGLFAMGGLMHQLDGDRWRKLTSPRTPALLFGIFLVLPMATVGWTDPLAANVLTWSAGILMALLVYTISLHQCSGTVRLLEWKPIAELGRISYGFYVFHYILSAEALRLMTHGWLDLASFPPVIGAVLLFAITIIVSRVSWKLIEAPALGLRDRLLNALQETGPGLPKGSTLREEASLPT